LRETGGQIHSRGRFSDSAFLVGDGNDAHDESVSVREGRSLARNLSACQKRNADGQDDGEIFPVTLSALPVTTPQ
jgi:hypothetical protein